MAEELGEREVVVARELTKLHEEIARGTAAALRERFGSSAVRGEIVILVRGAGRRRGAAPDGRGGD